MRELKTSIESHPLYLIITLILAILGLIFIFIEVHDHFNWNVI